MGAKKRTAEEVYEDVVAAIHRADPADAVVQIRSYASEVNEECARVGEREAVEFRITAAQVPDRFVCSEYLRAANALDHNARAIRSIEIK